MSKINKHVIINYLKAFLISLFFASPFIFIQINLAFLGNDGLIIWNAIIGLNVFYSIFTCILVDLTDEENKTKQKIKIILITILISLIFGIIISI